MSEKTLLIPRTYAPARAERTTRVQRCSSGRAALKLLGLAAFTGLVYYGIPEGESQGDVIVVDCPD